MHTLEHTHAYTCSHLRLHTHALAHKYRRNQLTFISILREFKPDGGEHWQQVTSLEKGKFYIQGNLELFRNLTGWKGSRVLYFGDHVYADLADAAMQHGWRTAAIIPEIENEVICHVLLHFE